MILNNAEDIKYGSANADYVYRGSRLVWQRGTPPIPPTPPEYSEDKLVLVLLDSNYEKTSTTNEFNAVGELVSFLQQEYNNGSSNKYYFWWGNNVYISPDPDLGNKTWFYWIAYYADCGTSNRPTMPVDNSDKLGIVKIRYRQDLTNVYYYHIKRSGYWNTILQTIIPPHGLTETFDCANYAALENLDYVLPINEQYIYFSPSYFVGCLSLKKLVIPYGIRTILYGGNYYCADAEEVEIPSTVVGINSTAFNKNAYPNISKITIDKPAGSISGSPWGATNANVIWTG